jgi:hypothetical protein
MERPTFVAAVAIASLFAGPIFVLFLTVATLYLQMPAPVPIDLSGFAMMPLALSLAAIVGFLPAFALNLAFASLMSLLARIGGPARSRAFWLAAGAGAGGLLVLLSGAGGGAAAALVATGAACGGMSWKGMQDAWAASA